MALVQCDFRSEVLGLDMTMNVILPRGASERGHDGKHPTLYLLHGLSGNQTSWLRKTSIERYAAGLDLAVVMPAVHRSRYTNMKCGGDYWTYISQEVPALAREFFPLSDRREDNFVAGASMGGYGAFKLGLKCSETFCAAAALSGACPRDWTGVSPERRAELEWIHGDLDQYPGGQDDLYEAVRDLVASDKPRPRIFQCCGREDFLYEDNVAFRAFLEDQGMDLTYEEEPGTHEWAYWDMKLQRVLQWLPLA